MAVLHGQPHSGIIRIVNFRAQDQYAISRLILERHGVELSSGAIATVNPGKLRLRMPD